jgi:carboxylate-amine ligase
MSKAASEHGVILAGTGLPPVGGDTVGTVTSRPRYRAIEAEMRETAAHQYSTGLHVHVEVPSRDAGVDALARLARWAPALLALTANSPLWCGTPTGFASWRHIKGLSWPVAGYPPPFSDGEDYAHSIDRFVASGVLVDPGVVTWVARLSENFPTLELRIADAQLEVRDSVAFAALVRSLVDRCLSDALENPSPPRYAPGLVNGAVWMAARDGLEATIVDPLTTEAMPAFELIERMVCSVERELERFGDIWLVEQHIERLRRDGGPARRQLERFGEAGLSGLIGLYRSGSAAGIGQPAAAM